MPDTICFFASMDKTDIPHLGIVQGNKAKKGSNDFPQFSVLFTFLRDTGWSNVQE